MNKTYQDITSIVNYAINEVMPESAVKRALANFKQPKGKTIMIAIGKAACNMAKATTELINIDKGLVVTKYNYAIDKLDNCKIIEAGHPVLDENSIKAGEEAIKLVSDLNKDDVVVFLVSGGGSSLFEVPLIPLNEFKTINDELLKCGANITEINTIRKRLSKVKGGKFAQLCQPAKVFNIILSDVIDDALDIVASGPTVEDATNHEDALKVVEKYHLNVDKKIIDLLNKDGVVNLNNVETYITGNNSFLKQAAKRKCRELGYDVVYIEEPLTQDVSEATKIMLNYYNQYKNKNNKIAIIAGGEITIVVKGKGLGGRNQHFCLNIAKNFDKDNAVAICVGSDGTDGPTDVAGGFADHSMIHPEIDDYLIENATYDYLKKYGGHILTGPTGTNVCDLYIILING